MVYVSLCVHNLTWLVFLKNKGVIFVNRSVNSEGYYRLTTFTAFVPQDGFQCGAKHKPHVLQHSLWIRDFFQMLSAMDKYKVGRTAFHGKDTFRK